MENLNNTIQSDVEAIHGIPIIKSLLEVICRTTGMGFAAVASVTEDRWVACSVLDEINFGLAAGGELKLETTICNEIRQHQQPVVMDDVEKDERYRQHTTPALYGFKSYISVPIFRRDKSFFGTLCAIDPMPAKVNTAATIGMFRLFADLISFHLNAVEELDLSQQKIAADQENAILREQFIAILGHDLRNPVAAISNSAALLTMISADADVLRTANIIKSSANRMTVLIKNMLDFASGRMGGGIPLNSENNIPIDKILSQVIAETSAVWPDRMVQMELDITTPVHADGNRIAQLFSNLLRNAVAYGSPGKTVTVKAFTQSGNFILSVTNYSAPIPALTMERLFQPFNRGYVNKGQQGLGLGLYIAAEIAKAHGGTLEVISGDTETCFTLTIPLG